MQNKRVLKNDKAIKNHRTFQDLNISLADLISTCSPSIDDWYMPIRYAPISFYKMQKVEEKKIVRLNT